LKTMQIYSYFEIFLFWPEKGCVNQWDWNVRFLEIIYRFKIVWADLPVLVACVHAEESAAAVGPLHLVPSRQIILNSWTRNDAVEAKKIRENVVFLQIPFDKGYQFHPSTDSLLLPFLLNTLPHPSNGRQLITHT
jgi:hypothetical protein